VRAGDLWRSYIFSVVDEIHADTEVMQLLSPIISCRFLSIQVPLHSYSPEFLEFLILPYSGPGDGKHYP
jgi:hypothetical protein